MPKTTEETALSTKEESSYELATTSLAATAQMEVQGAIIIAKRFPRNEDQTFAKLMSSCDRPSFAEKAAYAYPRGGVTVSGPSINLAREAARLWGNIEHGLLVIFDDDDTRQIRAWAWDKETNTKVFAEDTFKKLVQRKGGWKVPDERDLRELTNRRGAILVRNCILQLLPRDLVDDAMDRVKETAAKKAGEDPATTRKKIILGFSQLNITPDMLEKKLGHPISQSSPAELSELRQIWQSIYDGNSTWSEYIEPENGNGKKETEKGSLNMADLKPKQEEEKKPEPPKEPPKPTKPEMVAKIQAKVGEMFGYDETRMNGYLASITPIGTPQKYTFAKLSDMTEAQARDALDMVLSSHNEWLKKQK